MSKKKKGNKMCFISIKIKSMSLLQSYFLVYTHSSTKPKPSIITTSQVMAIYTVSTTTNLPKVHEWLYTIWPSILMHSDSIAITTMQFHRTAYAPSIYHLQINFSLILQNQCVQLQSPVYLQHMTSSSCLSAALLGQ